MNESDKAMLNNLQPVQDVLRRLVLALGALNPPAMPAVAYALKAATADETVSPPVRAMLWDLAEGIDVFFPSSTQ